MDFLHRASWFWFFGPKLKYSDKNSVAFYVFYQTVSTTLSCLVGLCNGKRQHSLCFDSRTAKWKMGKAALVAGYLVNTLFLRLQKGAELLQLVKMKKKHNFRQHYCVRRSQIGTTATLVLMVRISWYNRRLAKYRPRRGITAWKRWKTCKYRILTNKFRRFPAGPFHCPSQGFRNRRIRDETWRRW
jgi:hypothetical protein